MSKPFEPNESVFFLLRPIRQLGQFGHISEFTMSSEWVRQALVCSIEYDGRIQVETRDGYFIVPVSIVFRDANDALAHLQKLNGTSIEFTIPPRNERDEQMAAMMQRPAAAQAIGLAVEDSQVVGKTIAGKPIHEVRVSLYGSERYHTDRHHSSGVALCPKCLRAHDPAKIITCECGYEAPLVLRHNLEDCQLSDLIKLRDRLNEIIYDKEKAPQ